MSQIFISYSRKNRSQLDKLLPHLKEVFEDEGIWYDRHIRGGTNWWNEILQRVKECDVFLYLISEHSLKSSYCQAEFREALRLNKEVLPILLVPEDKADYNLAPHDLKQMLENTQYVLLIRMDTQSIVRVISATHHLLERFAKNTKEQPSSDEPEPIPAVDDKAKIDNKVVYISGIFLLISVVISGIFGLWQGLFVLGGVIPGNTPTQSVEAVTTQTLSDMPIVANITTIDPVEATLTAIYGTATAEGFITLEYLAPTETRLAEFTIETQIAERLATEITWTPTNTSTPTNTPTPTLTSTPLGGSGQLVFLRFDDTKADMFLLDIATGEDVQLTDNPANDWFPTWSPDGSQIAFISNRDGNYEIYIMNVDGSNQQRLTNNPWPDYSPTWSHDGTQIAFGSDRDQNAEIYIVDIDGSNLKNLTNRASLDRNPAWSPNGSQIAFETYRNGNSEIYLMDVDGSNLRNLTDNTRNDYKPAWSPDGTQIVFYSERDGNSEIYIMNTDGSNQRNLTNDTDSDYEPAWSPDGSQIAFISNRDGNDEIYIMNTDGNNIRRITNTSESESSVQWRPTP